MVYTDIFGVVKFTKPEGYGFIVPSVLVGAHNRDIFFHAASLSDKEIQWSDVRVGQQVRINTVIPNGIGLQAEGVMFI